HPPSREPRSATSASGSERAILIQRLAVVIRGPLVCFSFSNSFQAPGCAGRDAECRRIGHFRMVDPRYLPKAPACFSVAPGAGVEARLVLDDPNRECRTHAVLNGLSLDISPYRLCGACSEAALPLGTGWPCGLGLGGVAFVENDFDRYWVNFRHRRGNRRRA